MYVLERRRAVQVWHTLMGPADPDVAKQEAPNSIRAVFGLCKEQNAVMGAPDAETAEIQIQSIFASSPPFPTTDLPSDPYAYTSDPAQANGSDAPQTESVRSRSSHGTNGTAHGSSEGKSAFKARALPPTHASPDIVPRMSRAAALRAGIVDPAAQQRRYPATAESVARTFAGVPGHKRSETITVASTAPPVVAPRMTRAASLRLGQPVAATPMRPKAIEKAKSAGAVPAATFDGVPGHKRRESIAVASTKPPTVQPRSNRSAELRVHKEAAPPSSFNCKPQYPSCRAISSPGAALPSQNLVYPLPLVLAHIDERQHHHAPHVRGLHARHEHDPRRAAPLRLAHRVDDLRGVREAAERVLRGEQARGAREAAPERRGAADDRAAHEQERGAARGEDVARRRRACAQRRERREEGRRAACACRRPGLITPSLLMLSALMPTCTRLAGPDTPTIAATAVVATQYRPRHTRTLFRGGSWLYLTYALTLSPDIYACSIYASVVVLVLRSTCAVVRIQRVVSPRTSESKPFALVGRGAHLPAK